MFDPNRSDLWRFPRAMPHGGQAISGPARDKPATLADRIIMTIVVVVSVPWIILALLSHLGAL